MIDSVSASTHLKQTLSNPPTRSQEDWKYTDFQFFKKNNYALLNSDVENTVEYVAGDKKVLITVRAPLSNRWKCSELPTGLKIMNTSSLRSWEATNYFSDLSELLQAQPTQFIFDSTYDPELLVEVLWHPRETMAGATQFVHKCIVFEIKKRATVFMVERSFLNQKQFVNLDAQYILEAGAQLQILKTEKGQIDGRGCQTSRFRLEKDAQLQLATVSIGAEWSRHNVYAELVGENADAQFVAASVLQNKEYMDHHTWIDHKVGLTNSVQRYVSVLADESHSVFNGRVHIHPDAQKSTAEQTNRNLLLSKKAHVDTKPELLIQADDVKAKHGATVGQLNPDEIFYLRSRGIDKDKAQQMLTRGFVFDIGDRISPRFKDLFYKEISPSSDFLAEGV